MGKRLIKKSYHQEKKIEERLNEEIEEINNGDQEEIDGEDNYQENSDLPREDPFLGRYVEITNKRSKYYGYHAYVDEKFYSNRYRIYIEPKRYDMTDQEYIINYVDPNRVSKWFTVIE